MHKFGEDVVIFPNISWHRMAEVNVLWQKKHTDLKALLCPLSLLTIQDVTMKSVTFLTNTPDLVILSPKTKGSVIPHTSKIGQLELFV